MDHTVITTRAFFSGRVQGVGFRWQTQQIAVGFPVTGFVRNLSDGRVELLAQGARPTVERFVSEITNQLAGNIHAVTQESVSDAPEMSQFEIRRSSR